MQVCECISKNSSGNYQPQITGKYLSRFQAISIQSTNIEMNRLSVAAIDGVGARRCKQSKYAVRIYVANAISSWEIDRLQSSAHSHKQHTNTRIQRNSDRFTFSCTQWKKEKEKEKHGQNESEKGWFDVISNLALHTAIGQKLVGNSTIADDPIVNDKRQNFHSRKTEWEWNENSFVLFVFCSIHTYFLH